MQVHTIKAHVITVAIPAIIIAVIVASIVIDIICDHYCSLCIFAFCRRREGAAGLEDGTAHYLGIAAVRHGFHQLAALGGFPAIGNHTQSVTR